MRSLRDLEQKLPFPSFCYMFDFVVTHYNQEYPDSINVKVDKATTQRVFDAYSSDKRHYHTAQHPYEMFDEMMNITRPGYLLSKKEAVAITLMIIYHDVVYSTGENASQNELLSADWASVDMSAIYIGQQINSFVWAGIKASQTHTLEGVPRKYHNAVAHFLDLDLMRLGGSAESFANDTKLVTAEYLEIYSAEEIADGRKKWAKEFLQRDEIFLTWKFSHLEAQARSNLEKLTSS